VAETVSDDALEAYSAAIQSGALRKIRRAK
jgi:hypothetical protein